MQVGALYNYTPDKQSLLFGMMQRHMEALLASWDRLDKGDGPAAQLEAFYRFHIRYHLDRPNVVFVADMELRNLSPENFQMIEALRGSYETKLEAILQAGKAQGVFDAPDTKLATMAVIAMLTGVTNWYRDDGRLSRETVEQIYWSMVCKAVGV